MGQQNCCMPLLEVHLTMQLIHPKLGHVTITCVCVCVCVHMCIGVQGCRHQGGFGGLSPPRFWDLHYNINSAIYSWESPARQN